MTGLKHGSPIEGLDMEDVKLTAGVQTQRESVGRKALQGQIPLELMSRTREGATSLQKGAALAIREGRGAGDSRLFNAIGVTPAIPKQARNQPCGCGSGKKAKKCCGEYAKTAASLARFNH